MLQSETSNSSIFQFLDDLQDWLTATEERFDKDMLLWIVGRRKSAMENLKKPTEGDNAQMFLDVALKNGGVTILRDTYAVSMLS